MWDNFLKVKGKVMEAIQESDDLDLKAKVRNRLDDLGRLTQEILSIIKKSKGKNIDLVIDERFRNWRCLS